VKYEQAEGKNGTGKEKGGLSLEKLWKVVFSGDQGEAVGGRKSIVTKYKEKRKAKG